MLTLRRSKKKQKKQQKTTENRAKSLYQIQRRFWIKKKHKMSDDPLRLLPLTA